jgi:hypothetical protein
VTLHRWATQRNISGAQARSPEQSDVDHRRLSGC